jgi:hypothetical protein
LSNFQQKKEREEMDFFSIANLTTSFVICWEKIEKKEKKKPIYSQIWLNLPKDDRQIFSTSSYG